MVPTDIKFFKYIECPTHLFWLNPKNAFVFIMLGGGGSYTLHLRLFQVIIMKKKQNVDYSDAKIRVHSYI